MIYYVYRSLSKQKTGKGKISFATFQHFNIFASGSGPFFNYYMVPFLIIIYMELKQEGIAMAISAETGF